MNPESSAWDFCDRYRCCLLLRPTRAKCSLSLRCTVNSKLSHLPYPRRAVAIAIVGRTPPPAADRRDRHLRCAGVLVPRAAGPAGAAQARPGREDRLL